ncbi:Ran-binding protein 1 c [Zea mays]|uniref:Ran-specific GTPase-activating protein n=1 Tax=Zea mays TaxID=4577 RepID=A0A3L6E9S5_MAIZE|nr:Ran-binding protein 1 c [Zea mays]
MADKEPVVERSEASEEEDASAAAAAGEEEDTGAQVAPIVRLEEVLVTTGEEDEDVLLDMKAKLYRFDKDGNQWKERGTGTVKLLKNKETGKVRLVMRQAKTLKICANHLVAPTTRMQEHAGSDKSCVWHASDFADGELKEEMFAIRLAASLHSLSFTIIDGLGENLATGLASAQYIRVSYYKYCDFMYCKKFKELVEEIAESLTENEDKEGQDGSSTAGLLEKLTVSEGKSEESGKSESTDSGKVTETKADAAPAE